MKTLREYIDQLDEISRRDALKGIGAAAAGAVLGQPKDAEADWRKGADHVDKMTDKVYRKFHNTSTDDYADLDFYQDADLMRFQLTHNGGIFLPQSSYPNGRIKVDNGPVMPVQFVIFSNTRNSVGIAAGGGQPFGDQLTRLENYILSAKQRILLDVTELTRLPEKIITFRI